MVRAIQNLSFVLIVVAFTTTAFGQGGNGIRLELLARQRWQVGMTVDAPGNITGIVASIPVPMKWPEQVVKIVGEEKTSHVRSIRYRTVDDGVTQMVVSIPRIKAGDVAKVVVTFEIFKASIHGPTNTSDLRTPVGYSRKLQAYLGKSPGIESTDSRIEQLAAEIVKGEMSDWQKAEAIYDWVQANIEYKFDPVLKGAIVALEAKRGDCEELASLFIALCRANDIPARSVWVPGHCYAEFYLEDANGVGHWFPCQSAGTRQFGNMQETRPILQKGDSFKPTGERQAKRYLAETFAAKNADADPKVQWIRKLVPESGQATDPLAP